MSAPQARRQDYDYLIKLLLIGDSGEQGHTMHGKYRVDAVL